MKTFSILFFSTIALVVFTFALVGLTPVLVTYLFFNYLKTKNGYQRKSESKKIPFEKIKLFLNEKPSFTNSK
jgi:hypothetical protein